MVNASVVHGKAVEEMAKFEDAKFDAIITDPPYDLSEMDMISLLMEFKRICLGTIIIFGAPENQWPKPDQFCFWTKPISTKNTIKHYSRFVEVIHIYDGPTSKWNTGRNWANYVNVFPDYLEADAEHPYQKPISLMERLVLNHTIEGSLILDPFCGSGTTLVAAQRSGRNSLGIEEQAKYVDVAKKRLGI